MIGVCGVVHVDGTGPDVELVYEFQRSAWGQGYATEAARACLAAAFGPLGLERVVALAYPENAQSIRIMQKFGMRDAGTIDAYGHELVCYERWRVPRQPLGSDPDGPGPARDGAGADSTLRYDPQRLGVLERGLVVGVAAQHPRQLLDHLAPRPAGRRSPPPASSGFSTTEVRVGGAGDLGQVGDDEQLGAFGERGQLVGDRPRRAPADAGVDLVEEQDPRPAARPRRDPDRERDARELAARRRLGHRSGGKRRGRRQLEHGAVGAPRADVGRLDPDGEDGLGHAEVGQLGLDRARERLGGRGARSGQALGAVPGRLGGRRGLGLEPGELLGGALEPLERPAGGARRLDHLAERRGIPALELGEGLEPRLDMLEPGRVGLEPGQVAAELCRRVLDAQRDLVEGRGDIAPARARTR